MRLALEFRADAVSLFENVGADWTLIEESSIGSPATPGELDAAMLRLVGLSRKIGEAGAPPIEIWLPAERILTLELDHPDQGADPGPLIEAALVDASPAPLSELFIAHIARPGGVSVAAVEAVVVEDALSYARKWGVYPVRVTTDRRARAALAAFPEGPDFDAGEGIAPAPVLGDPAGDAAMKPLSDNKGAILAETTAAPVGSADRRLKPALLGAAALAIAVVGFFIFRGDSPPPPATTPAAPIIAPAELAAPAPPLAPRLAVPFITVEAGGGEGTSLAAATTLPSPRRAAAPSSMDNGGVEPSADPQAGRPIHAEEPDLAVGPRTRPGGSMRIRDATQTPEPPEVAEAPAEIGTSAIEATPADAETSTETPQDGLAGLETALAQVMTLPLPRPGPVAAEAATDTESITSEAEIEAAEAGDEPGPPGPGAVARSPSPGPRPDALDMTPSERIATQSPTPKKRPKSIRPRVPAAAIAAGEPNVREIAAPRRPPPQGAGVANAATLRDVIRLSDMNLLGVFGSAKSRRALLRLPSGQVLRVSQGTVVEGWVVSRIDATSLRITRGGDARTLELAR